MQKLEQEDDWSFKESILNGSIPVQPLETKIKFFNQLPEKLTGTVRSVSC